MKIIRGSARQAAYFFLIGLIIGIAAVSLYGKSGNNSASRFQDELIPNKFGRFQEKLITTSDFYNYARIRDVEFSELLKETWHDYSISPGIAEEVRRNLNKQPVFNPSGLDQFSPVSLPFSGVVGVPDRGTDQSKSFPGIRKPENDFYSSVKGSFLFYGQQINIRYDKLLLLSTSTSASEDSISGFWTSFSRSNSNHLVDQLMDYRDRLGLGDWGYFQLVKATSTLIFPDNHWSADQLTWAVMIRSGFDVRLAFNQSSTTVLFPSENTIFERQFVIIGNKRFYLDREMRSPLLITSPNPFPDSGGMIDLRFYKSLNFSGKLTTQKFTVNWKNRKYEFALRVNPNEVRFYSEYPKTDAAVYFGAPVSSVLKEDLLRQFYPILAKINKTEAATLLQQFVQFNFEYYSADKKDVVPGRFAEELIASRSGDDRGKSVLLSLLIRNLLHLPVLGVLFPGFYSTAVCYEEKLDGDSYIWRNGKFIITDPTFQNAPVGVLMPEFSGLTPKLIDIPNGFSSSNDGAGIWKLAYKMGAKRGGVSQDLIIDHQGRAFITGYFAGSRSNYPFIACFSDANTLQWIRKFEGDGEATSFAIAKFNEEEIYIAGTFSGKLEMDGQTIRSSPKIGSLFLAQFNRRGELIWIKAAPADSTLHDNSLACVIKSDRSGDSISVQYLNADERNVSPGFREVSETGLVLICPANFRTFYRSLPLVNGDIAGELVKTYTGLNLTNGPQRVAIISALLKWLQKTGNEVTGIQIQKFINQIYPSFSSDEPSLFNSVGRIAWLKNVNGVISLKTTDYKSLFINNLRIENGARFIVSVFGNGDTSVKVISGFQNIGNPVILPLNNLLIDFSSGNFIEDYDYDHTLKTVFLKSGP